MDDLYLDWKQRNNLGNYLDDSEMKGQKSEILKFTPKNRMKEI